MRIFKRYKHGTKKGGQTYHVRKSYGRDRYWICPNDGYISDNSGRCPVKDRQGKICGATLIPTDTGS